jgi:hypothetical protein
MEDKIARLNEWFVPQFGPIRFRIFVGMLFLPYTGMCVSFGIVGSLLSPSTMAWDRVVAVMAIYFAALGISAHAADSMGSKSKPWGNRFSNLELSIMLVCGLIVAYGIGTYYIVYYVPLLLPIAILEGFFLFAYNFEIWNGFFHNNLWFAISWGSMPVLAGYIMQTNSLSDIAILVSVAAFLVSYVEIKLSRKYKQTKQNRELKSTKDLEMKLKIVSITTILFTITFLFFRVFQITF